MATENDALRGSRPPRPQQTAPPTQAETSHSAGAVTFSESSNDSSQPTDLHSRTWSSNFSDMAEQLFGTEEELNLDKQALDPTRQPKASTHKKC